MLDAGGGGGYGGTNWSATSVIDMWLAVSNQETTPHWQLLSGWRKSYELTLQHMAQVKSYRENLAAAWPPEKSPAAAAYLARLDELITHLQGTYDAAIANYTAFSNATLALSSARTDLEKVVNEYLANEGKLQTFAREQAERPKGGLQRGPEPKPPVPDGRQAELEARARSIMYGLSSELSQARTGLKQPTLYDDRKIVEVGGSDSQDDRYVPTPIPPVTPFQPDARVSSGLSPAVHQPNAPINPGPPHIAGKVPGLILGGVDAPTPPPSPPITTPTPPINSPAPPGITPPLLPPTSPNVPTLPVGQTPRPAPGESLGRPIASGPTNPPRGAMPPGGIIGGIPGSGLGQPATGRTTTHVNPVGGLLNPGAQTQNNRNGTSGRMHAPGIVPTSHPGRTTSHSGDETGVARRWDPDNPWETAEGVAPIVAPMPEKRIDPGPAIGLK